MRERGSFEHPCAKEGLLSTRARFGYLWGSVRDFPASHLARSHFWVSVPRAGGGVSMRPLPIVEYSDSNDEDAAAAESHHSSPSSSPPSTPSNSLPSMSPHTASGSGGEAGGAAAAHELEAEEEFEDVSGVNPLTAGGAVADVGEPEVEEDDLGYTAAGPRRTDNRKRKTERKSTKCTYAPIAGCQGLTREETNTKLLELSQRECCGGSWGGRDDLSPLGGNVWRGRADRSTKAVREYYRVRRCCFYKESDCCYVIQETYDVATGTFSLSRAGVHSDHTQSNRKVRTCPRAAHLRPS